MPLWLRTVDIPVTNVTLLTIFAVRHDFGPLVSITKWLLHKKVTKIHNKIQDL